MRTFAPENEYSAPAFVTAGEDCTAAVSVTVPESAVILSEDALRKMCVSGSIFHFSFASNESAQKIPNISAKSLSSDPPTVSLMSSIFPFGCTFDESTSATP